LQVRSFPSKGKRYIIHAPFKNAGQPPDRDLPPRVQGYGDNSFSFRTPSEASHARPALSAPIGQRGILAEVRATQFGGRLPNPVLLPLRCARDTPQAQQLPESEPEQTPTVTSMSVPPRQGGTMSLGKRSARMDALAWLSSFRVGERVREGSPGTGSGVESGDASRIASRSRPPSRDANITNMPATLRKRSDSRGHWEDENEKQSLQDE
jgi:WD repeat-containing protein 59